MHRLAFSLLLFLAISPSSFAQNSKGTNKLGWYTDYPTAKAEARKTGKPMFVVFRCEPCTDAALFDEQVVHLEKEIADASDEFVRVRLLRITGVDLRVFDFDYDLTWFAFFVNADETIYGRYGGRDSSSPHDRLSLRGLRFAMERALDAHKNPPKAAVRTEPSRRAEGYAGAKRIKGNCIHCHYVNEFRRAELKSAGKWERDTIWVYPPPENVGITLDIDRGNLVKAIRADSPAATAGLKVGDIVEQLNGNSVASFADASYALHQAPARGSLSISWMRDGKVYAAKLNLEDGWRKTDISWRPSLFDLLPSVPLSGTELNRAEKQQLGLAENRFAFRQDKFVHSTLKAVGLQKDDIILGIDDRETIGGLEDFAKQLKRHHLVGDKVKLNVVRDGKRMELEMGLK